MLLVAPLVISPMLSITGMIAGRSDYERWLFEGVIFRVLDAVHGSYLRSLALWLGATALFLCWVRVIVWCFTLLEEDR